MFGQAGITATRMLRGFSMDRIDVMVSDSEICELQYPKEMLAIRLRQNGIPVNESLDGVDFGTLVETREIPGFTVFRWTNAQAAAEIHP
jgi:hypothetical protein